ncbi:MAG: uncharacterized protein A8A55_1242 [Amphiamblys sp. WSBS2006]|nr:MAG: uncharacterized protein A8A55_1242 [Amphiamblys sp. WSBS2006]
MILSEKTCVTVSKAERELLRLKKQRKQRGIFSSYPEQKKKTAKCVVCDVLAEWNDELLLPVCRKRHAFMCKSCVCEIFEEGGKIKYKSGGCANDKFLEEYEKSVGGHKGEVITADMIIQPKPVSSLALTIPNMQDISVLLTLTTEVYLEDIALSVFLLFKLLERTEVFVGKNVSIFGHPNSGDCISGDLDATHGEIVLRTDTLPSIENKFNFLRKINRIPPNSIACKCKEVFLEKEHHLLILPKLKLHRENEMKCFVLKGLPTSLVFTISNVKNKSIWLGKVKKLELIGYSVYFLPKLLLHDENEMESLVLKGTSSYLISKTLKKEIEKARKHGGIWLGKVEKVELVSYAIYFVSFLKLHGDTVVKSLKIADVDIQCMDTMSRPVNYKLFSWKIEKMKLENSTVRILQKIRAKKSCVLEEFVLVSGKEKESIKPSLMFSGSIYLGRVKQTGFDVPKHIRPMLKYSLVDEKGNSVENNI